MPPDGWPEKTARFSYIVVTRFFSIAVLLAAWEILARSGTFTPYQLPALSNVLLRIWSDAVSGDLAINTALTLYRALVSFAICAVLGSRVAMIRLKFAPLVRKKFVTAFEFSALNRSASAVNL